MSQLRLTRRFSAALCLGALVTFTSAAVDAATPPPADHSAAVLADDPAYADGVILEDAGVVMLPDAYHGSGSRRAMTRLEFAHAVTRLFPMLLDNRLPNNADPGAKQSWPNIRRQLSKMLTTHPEAIPALERLIDEFSPEIRQLGERPEEAKKVLADLAKPSPFPDVPRDHWAAQAVRDLQTAGIIAGYPNGRF